MQRLPAHAFPLYVAAKSHAKPQNIRYSSQKILWYPWKREKHVFFHIAPACHPTGWRAFAY